MSDTSINASATSPFQSCSYSASPSPSPSTRTTPLLAYPVNSVQAIPPTHGLQMCQSSSTSHWGDCHPNRSTMLSPPPTWTHPRSTPLSMPSSKLRTAVISNISARSAPRTKNTRLRSTSWRKTSSMPSHISLTIRRPLSKPQMGTLLTIGSPRLASPLGRGQMSLPSGSNSSMTDALRGIASTTVQGTSPTSKRYMLLPSTALSTHQKFFPTGFGRPFKGHLSNTKSSTRLFGTLTTGGFTLRSSTTINSTKTSSPSRPSSISTTPPLPPPKTPDFSLLLGWKRHDFPSGFRIWEPQFGPCPTSPYEERGRKDADVHTRAGRDV